MNSTQNTDIDMEFHHIHAYVDSLCPLAEYKQLESRMNTLCAAFVGECGKDVAKGAQKCEEIFGEKPKPEDFKVNGQDLVEQLISGVGFRVTAEHTAPGANGTRSMLINSQDARGAKFVVTVREEAPAAKKAKTEVMHHFSKEGADMYYQASKAEGGRPGVAVVAFESSKVAEIRAKYTEKHPELIYSYHEYGAGASLFKVLEVFAYYKSDNSKKADQSTRIRFLQRGDAVKNVILPGFVDFDATFPEDAMPAYSDHWVSNVVNRNEFLATLEDTLGFTPKVDFNAGVVAAGEAIIESTVTGNTPCVEFSTPEEIMLNQSQIYLPINNALSEVGHVHLFLEEIGQGIQHIASRVVDLTSFVERTNQYRKMTGRGFTFLNIPRSYYGYLTVANLVAAKVPDKVATDVFTKLQEAGLMNKAGIVEMDITDAAIKGLGFPKAHLAGITSVVKLARYNNLHKMLGAAFDEVTYLKIVENKILVDIQAGDILFQIFTGNILQRAAGMESPFLEFIQRVCSKQNGSDGKPKPIRPGCGGFGIRNFLTLFLSIEVSKAMKLMETSKEAGDMATFNNAESQVTLFTEQLDLSNPILTTISDAMCEEADALVEVNKAGISAADKAAAEAEAQKHFLIKEQGQKDLQALSDKYKLLMRELREKK